MWTRGGHVDVVYDVTAWRGAGQRHGRGLDSDAFEFFGFEDVDAITIVGSGDNLLIDDIDTRRGTGAVPEPSGLGLVPAGLGAIRAAARRRASAHGRAAGGIGATASATPHGFAGGGVRTTPQSPTMGRERWKPSVTVAAVIEKDGRYLMIEEMTRDGLRINNPAGGLEPGEAIIDGAKREALEETACHFTPEALLGVYLARNPDTAAGPGVTYVRFAFCGTASDPVPGQALDSPVVRTLWMTADEIVAAKDRLRGPLVLQCIEDHRAGRRLPLDVLYTHASVADPDATQATSEP